MDEEISEVVRGGGSVREEISEGVREGWEEEDKNRSALHERRGGN